jgi:hypothetical protein
MRFLFSINPSLSGMNARITLRNIVSIGALTLGIDPTRASGKYFNDIGRLYARTHASSLGMREH